MGQLEPIGQIFLETPSDAKFIAACDMWWNPSYVQFIIACDMWLNLWLKWYSTTHSSDSSRLLGQSSSKSLEFMMYSWLVGTCDFLPVAFFAGCCFDKPPFFCFFDFGLSFPSPHHQSLTCIWHLHLTFYSLACWSLPPSHIALQFHCHGPAPQWWWASSICTHQLWVHYGSGAW